MTRPLVSNQMQSLLLVSTDRIIGFSLTSSPNTTDKPDPFRQVHAMLASESPWVVSLQSWLPHRDFRTSPTSSTFVVKSSRSFGTKKVGPMYLAIIIPTLPSLLWEPLHHYVGYETSPSSNLYLHTGGLASSRHFLCDFLSAWLVVKSEFAKESYGDISEAAI